MLGALYFPYTTISNKNIIKNALLLWDQVETIVPTRDPALRPIHQTWSSSSSSKSESRLLREAEELIVRHRVPTEKDQAQAHQAIKTMAESGHLATLVQKSLPKWENIDYHIYSEKFFHSTWAMLERRGLANWIHEEYDYRVPAVVGLVMMSVLADTCAGTQIQTITDHTEAYTWLAKQRANLLGSQYVTGFDASQIAPDHDRLVTLSFDALDGRRISLKALVEMRKRELKNGGTDYTAMRQRYSRALAAHVERIKKEAKSGNDLQELDRQFKNEIKQDVADLQSELRISTTKTLFANGVATSIILTAGCLIHPIKGLTTLAQEIGILGIVPLLKAAADYRGARREALKKHSMSWLFLARQRRIPTI